MIQHIARSFHRGFHFLYGRYFPVNRFADIVQHVPVVGFSAVRQVAAYQILLHAVKVTNIIGGIRCHGSIYRYAFVGRLLYLLTLLFDNAQAHAVDKYHVITCQVVEVVERYFTKFDG